MVMRVKDVISLLEENGWRLSGFVEIIGFTIGKEPEDP